MATEVQHHTEPSLASLVGGIINDLQDLIKQQLKLTRQEIEADLRKTKEGASILALAVGFLLLSTLMFCLMLSALIHWLASPPNTDPASIPLWACHLIVGVVLLIPGIFLAVVGKKKIEQINPVQSPATEALKENVQWMTTPK
jgi:uncharacterized BrkB/YihY/UPF0761 family membrane protein